MAQGGVAGALARAFSLRLDPAELSAADSSALTRAAVSDPHHQAFLVWRRSIVMVTALAMVPLVLLRLFEVLGADGLPGTLKALHAIPVLAEAALGATLWMQLGRWTRWREQQRALTRAYALAFLAPFAVYLVPAESFARDMLAEQLAALGAGESRGAGGLMAITIGYSLQSLLAIGPRAVALMPGAVRAAMVTKLLLPGTAAPGWLIVLGTPLCALMIYVLLLVPYQLTGSGYFALALAGLAAGQLSLARAGYRLTRPTSYTDALSAVMRVRTTYLATSGLGGLFLAIALARLTSQLGLSAASVLAVLLSLAIHILLLTLLGTDLIIASLERAKATSIDAQAAASEAQARLAVFGRGAASSPAFALAPMADTSAAPSGRTAPAPPTSPTANGETSSPSANSASGPANTQRPT